MEYLWNIYGISMEYLWNIYGISMEYLWDIYGISMGYGIFLGYDEIFMGFYWIQLEY
jgi:hypothetical protein